MELITRIEGVDVHVEGTGAQTILMIHGWPDSYKLWDPQVAFYSRDFRCVRFSLPGFEGSRSRKAYSLDDHIMLIRRIVETTCPDGPVILMLHDWGCLFGYEFANRHSELVSRIIAADVGDAMSGDHLRSLTIAKRSMIAGYQLWLALAWLISGRLGVRMTRRMARILGVPGDHRAISASMNYPYFILHTGAHGSYAELGKVTTQHPTLYFYGTRKPFMFHSPEWMQRLASTAGCLVIPVDAGHWLTVERPDLFNREVANWLSGSANSSSTILGS